MLKEHFPKIAKMARRCIPDRVVHWMPACRKHAPHAEHIGFVAYAGCEVFHASALIFAVSVWLFATGLVVMVLIDLCADEIL